MVGSVILCCYHKKGLTIAKLSQLCMTPRFSIQIVISTTFRNNSCFMHKRFFYQTFMHYIILCTFVQSCTKKRRPDVRRELKTRPRRPSDVNRFKIIAWKKAEAFCDFQCPSEVLFVNLLWFQINVTEIINYMYFLNIQMRRQNISA